MSRIPAAADVQRIIDSRTAERLDLEFKGDPWPSTDGGKKECLKDISAMANTRGGLILLGVEEENNAASSLKPIDAATAERERSRINDLVNNGLDPRLYGLNLEPVAIDGGVVMAIDVPRSASRPHRVTTGGTSRFYLRHSTGVMEATTADLRNLFMQSAEIRERAQFFHNERRALIRAGDVVPNIFAAQTGVFLHLIPADAFAPIAFIDPRDARALHEEFRPILTSSWNSRFTFDGFANCRSGEVCRGYTLVRRDGIVEAVSMDMAYSEGRKLPAIPVYLVEELIVEAALSYVSGLYRLGVAPPVYALVTIDGVAKHRLATEEKYFDRDRGDEITRDVLALSLATIESVESEAIVGAALRPAFDTLWNAGGFPGSPSYESGEWKRRGRTR